MPWKETDVMSERIRFVVEAVTRHESMAGLCRRYSISRKTGYKWLARYESVGHLADLGEHSRRPQSSPLRTDPSTEQAVLDLREETGWGARKLRRVLESEQGIQLATSTVHRILVRHDRIAPRGYHLPAVQRFERSEPNALWQMDFKGPYSLRRGLCHPLSILDDHSRYVVGLYPMLSQTGASVKARLSRTFERYGVPESMLTDHGTPWWATSNGHGLTSLGVWLIRQGVNLIHGAIGHPQTQGKVERFHRSLAEGLEYRGVPRSYPAFARALSSYRREYNTRRPHEALGDAVPESRYRPSPRAYNPTPEAWSYPEGLFVRRITDAGLLNYNSRQYFVCHALAGRNVGCERLGEGKLVVHYRQMLVREIDQVSGRTMAIVRPETWRKVLPMS